MSYITADHAYGDTVNLYYEESGTGRPVVLIHGYPLDSRLWTHQITALTTAGHRTIAYDRRGFGRSTPFKTGHDFDTFAADLDALLTELGLTDAALVGHGMGTGDIVRYLGAYGSDRISRAALLAPLPPLSAPVGTEPRKFRTCVVRRSPRPRPT
ncbi:alpha/beta fold hydrolase [Streptomyces sp. NPDC051286]|uniref:alpha/beta fold hydrolase n=1 Tax=Streptomyces sp. NPDC051286 TaxID=3365647 RepID=UPI00378F2033